MPIEREIREHCERVINETVCKEVEKIIRDRGIEITKEPKAVITGGPVIKDGKIGGQLGFRIDF